MVDDFKSVKKNILYAKSMIIVSILTLCGVFAVIIKSCLHNTFSLDLIFLNVAIVGFLIFNIEVFGDELAFERSKLKK